MPSSLANGECSWGSWRAWEECCGERSWRRGYADVPVRGGVAVVGEEAVRRFGLGREIGKDSAGWLSFWGSGK